MREQRLGSEHRPEPFSYQDFVHIFAHYRPDNSFDLGAERADVNTTIALPRERSHACTDAHRRGSSRSHRAIASSTIGMSRAVRNWAGDRLLHDRDVASRSELGTEDEPSEVHWAYLEVAE
jgi:hypothetical protein